MAKEKIRPLSIWTDIEKTYGEEIYVIYEGKRIVGIGKTDWEDAVSEIDILCKKLQTYKKELEVFYGIHKGKVSHRSSLATYIYILKCHNTGLYKIGRSINPGFREKTLMGQIPSITTVFISPVTHPSAEKELHKIFKEKRVRGEWFSLNESDLKFIKKYNYGIN
jgi:hypothetical protein